MNKKILYLDIEASNLAANFGFCICIGYKWEGDKKARCITVTDDKKRFKKNPTDDTYVIREAAKLIEQADLVVTHYGLRYDIPFIQTRMLIHGMSPLPPIAHLDTWLVARKKLKLNSNRLATVCEALGLENKTPILGTHWVNASAGNKNSIKYVVKHCLQDVEVLQQAYHKLKAVWPTHPNLAKERGECGVCGKCSFESKGVMATLKQKFRRLRCRNCGHYTRELLK